MTFRKAPFAVAFFILLSLPACSPSWVSDPFTAYLKKKTGIELKWEDLSLKINPLRLEARGTRLTFTKDDTFWDLKIRDLEVAVGWHFSWEDLPWPKLSIQKVVLNQPRVVIRLPKSETSVDWKAWLKTCPPVRYMELKDLKVRGNIGNQEFELAPGTRIKGSFSPDQGGKIEYQLKGLRGKWAAKGIQFQGQAQGSVELSNPADHPQWKGEVSFRESNLVSDQGKIKDLSGVFHFHYRDSIFTLSTPAAGWQELSFFSKDRSFQGRGKMTLAGKFQLEKRQGLFSGVAFRVDELDFAFKGNDQWIKGRAEGQGQVSGPFSKPSFQGTLGTRQTDLHLHPVDSQGLETEIEFQGTGSSLTLTVNRAQAPKADWFLTSGLLSLINPEARFSGQLVNEGQKIHLKEIRLKTDNWGTLTGNLVIDLSQGQTPAGGVRAEGFPLPRFLTLFFPTAADPFPMDVPCQGTLKWSREGDGSPVVFRVSITPAPFSFKIPVTDWEGEGLQTRIKGQGKWFPQSPRIEWESDQELFGGHIFRPPWIFDLYQNPLKTQWAGLTEGMGQDGTLRGSLEIRSGPLGLIKISGEWPYGSNPRSYSATLEIQNLPLEKGYPLLVGRPLVSSHPFLGKVSLEGLLAGRLSFQKREEAYTIQGRLTGRGMDLKISEPSFSFQGIDVDLPFQMSTPGFDPGQGLFSESGFFNVERLKGPDLAGDRLHLPILAKPDQLELTERVQLPFRGGWVSLNSLVLTNPLGDFKLKTSLELKDLVLNRFGKDPDSPGILNGHLAAIRIDKEKAEMEGTLKAQIFDGLVEGANLAIVNPFSPGRCLQGDFVFSHLNLEPLTQQYSFGKITGYVGGEVKKLSVCSNRPERFELVVRTEDVPGVPKSIHVKAVENIGLLGTGFGQMDVLGQGGNRLINAYDYQEIGLYCSLNEDRFRVRGTIIEQEVEYIVRKPNWFGIDIINKNPDNEIRFSDILERIQRVEEKKEEGNQNEKK